jgi:hypothetical protein
MKKRYRKKYHKYYMGTIKYEIEFNVAWREFCSTLKIGESISVSRRRLVPNNKQQRKVAESMDRWSSPLTGTMVQQYEVYILVI